VAVPPELLEPVLLQPLPDPPEEEPAPEPAPQEPPAAEQPPKQIGPDPETPAADAPHPDGSKVPYSSKDDEGLPVPPPGTLPEDANMVHVGDDPAGGNARFYRGPYNLLYHRDEDGNWSRASPHLELTCPPRPQRSEMAYSSFDENNNYVPPPGTPPERAGLEYIGMHDGLPLYRAADHSFYWLTPDGKYHKRA
jgi:hypothetical protein